RNGDRGSDRVNLDRNEPVGDSRLVSEVRRRGLAVKGNLGASRIRIDKKTADQDSLEVARDLRRVERSVVAEPEMQAVDHREYRDRCESRIDIFAEHPRGLPAHD